MPTEKKDFDKEAVSWDNPTRTKLATDIVNAVKAHIPMTSDMNVLEFGCGTGLVTLQLQPLVRSITGVDSSRGMLDILNLKIAEQNLSNVRTLLRDFDKGDVLDGCYHLIVSSMTLHHVKEIRPLLEQFSKITETGGYLCIADLDLEDGRFHEDNTGVFHFGFDRSMLRKLFMEAGFEEIQERSAAEVVKPAQNGEMRRFPVFLMSGRKSKA